MQNLVQRVYDKTIRQHLPRKLAVCNGVAVPRLRLFDKQRQYPEYEGPMCDAIHQSIQPGDDVVVIGAGLGVTTVLAAEQSAPDGSVVAFEPAPDRAKLTQRTVDINGVSESVDVRNRAVETPKHINGEPSPNEGVDINQVPSCDVLELDCEGSEIEILDRMTRRPRAIRVEYHENYGSARNDVEERLQSMGYETKHMGLEVSNDGIGVLLATRTDE